MPRTIAIGDVHGCAAALEALLAAINLAPDDTLVMLGDYIDRGPESRRVAEILLDLRSKCRLAPLLGNHEIMLLNARDDWRQREFWLSYGGRETLASYGDDFDAIPDEHWQFFESCLRYFETETHLFVHANYDSYLPLDEQADETLFWTHLMFHLPRRHVSGKSAVVGHTPQHSGEILRLDYLIGLDTYCVGGGYLSALDVNSDEVWQATCEGKMRDG